MVTSPSRRGAVAGIVRVLASLATLAWLAASAAPVAAQAPGGSPGPIGVQAAAAASPLELRFLDVGQGDAVLVRAPDGRAVLVDGGEDGGRLLAHLERADVRSLEVVIASHNHADHIGGLTDVITRYRPRYVIENGVPHTTRTYERFLRAVAAAGSQRLAPTRRTLSLDSVQLTILPPPGAGGQQNDNSVGLRIDYGAFSATLLGDSESGEQQWWLTHHADLLHDVEVHKASHHGSGNGDARNLLTALSPEVVVVSVGAGNRYGHPAAEVLALHRQLGAETYRTDLHGTITITAEFDGSYQVRTERRPLSSHTRTIRIRQCEALDEPHE